MNVLQSNLHSQFPIKTALRLVFEKLPFFLLAVGSSIFTFLFQKAVGAASLLNQVSLPARMGNALVSYTAYLLNLFSPVARGSWNIATSRVIEYMGPGLKTGYGPFSIQVPRAIAISSLAAWQRKSTCRPPLRLRHGICASTVTNGPLGLTR